MTVSTLLGYGALIIRWKLEIPVKSAPNPACIPVFSNALARTF